MITPGSTVQTNTNVVSYARMVVSAQSPDMYKGVQSAHSLGTVPQSSCIYSYQYFHVGSVHVLYTIYD